MKQFGLIGRTLKHSFSKQYFTDKFEQLSITDSRYDLFELENISEFPTLIDKFRNQLSGMNVTIPYKKDVMPFLDEIDENAKIINAVNTIKFLPDGRLKGFNTDYYGFRNSLTNWNLKDCRALVLGTGGASNAVIKVLNDLKIGYRMISRISSGDILDYDQVKEQKLLLSHQLIVNTTPLGTFPKVDEKPSLDYDLIGENHFLFDLVYNPSETAFMKEGMKRGASVKNGYDMLVGQAEASWKIWNS